MHTTQQNSSTNLTNDPWYPICRKLTGAMRKELRTQFVDAPGIPQQKPHIARKRPEYAESWETFWSSAEWQYPRYKAQWQDICAILPSYLPDGQNGSIIYYIDGAYDVLKNRLEWVLDDLLQHMLTSKKQLHKQSVLWMGGQERRRVPLVANPNFCLIPVKCRDSLRHNDTVTGYVALQHILKATSMREWYRQHRDEEDLHTDYNTVLNRSDSNMEYGSPEASVLFFKQGNQNCTYKLIVRDSITTLQNNIYLGHKLQQYYASKYQLTELR